MVWCSTAATGLLSVGDARAVGPVVLLLVTGLVSAAGVALLPLLLKRACAVRLPWASPSAVGAGGKLVKLVPGFCSKKSFIETSVM
jgi:hypothetical protein